MMVTLELSPLSDSNVSVLISEEPEIPDSLKFSMYSPSATRNVVGQVIPELFRTSMAAVKLMKSGLLPRRNRKNGLNAIPRSSPMVTSLRFSP